MGLLDDFGSFIKTPEGQGLLSAAFGGMAGAARGAPINTIGRAGMSGLLGYANAMDRNLEMEQNAKRNQMYDLQLSQAKRALEMDDAIRAAGKDSMRTPEQMAMSNGQGPTVANAANIPNTVPSFDASGFVNRVMAIDPMKGLTLQASMAKDTPFDKVNPKDYTPESVARFSQTRNFGDLVPRSKMEVAPSGQVFNPYTIQPGQVLADPNKPFSVGPNGSFVPNVPYQQYEIGKAKAGATNVSLKTDVKTGESLAGQVGPMMKDSAGSAEAAVRQIDAAQRIVKAVDNNKVFAGPGASTHLRIAQFGDVLGVTGKDAAEKIANTRQTIRGLAELTLQGRQQMRGQGAITESESALAEKAVSGNIDDLTPAEIKLLAKASERAARHVYGEHQRKLKIMQQNPSLQGVAPFYSAPEIPAEMPSGASGVRRYNPATGRIE